MEFNTNIHDSENEKTPSDIYSLHSVSRSTYIKRIFLDYDRDLMLGFNNEFNDDRNAFRLVTCPTCSMRDSHGDSYEDLRKVVNTNSNSMVVARPCPVCKGEGWVYVPRRFSSKYEHSIDDFKLYRPESTNINFT